MVTQAPLHGSLHEQISPLVFAPPLVEVSPEPLPPPRDGKAYRALMVGGREHTAKDLREDLKAYGIALMPQHWHADREKLAYEVPAGTEIMLIVTTVIGHKLSNHARDLAKKAGIPYIGITTKASSWDKAFGRYGLKSPPAWRVLPKLVAVPAPDPVPDEDKEPIDPWGKTLASERKKANLTQAELGERMDCAGTTIQGWESGKQSPRFAFYRVLVDLLPALRNHAPPIALKDRVFEVLAPTPEQIQEAAPTPPLLTPIAECGVQYANAIAEAESHKRTADNLMRAAEDSLVMHKAAMERADRLQTEIHELATKGA